jgi:hypothetical protein
MDLNKLTKKELVEHAKSLDISVYKDDTKAELIRRLGNYSYANCAGCNKKIEDPGSAQSLNDESKRMYSVQSPDYRSSVELCEVCYNEWSDVPKGFKLEVNKSNGGLWYRPLSKKEKSAVRADKLIDPEFMLGWWIKGCSILILIAVIYQFI